MPPNPKRTHYPEFHAADRQNGKPTELSPWALGLIPEPMHHCLAGRLGSGVVDVAGGTAEVAGVVAVMGTAVVAAAG